MWPFKHRPHPLLSGAADRLTDLEVLVAKKLDRDELADMRTIDVVRQLQRETLTLAASNYALWFRLDELRKRLA
jgi:hypothetical protein